MDFIWIHRYFLLSSGHWKELASPHGIGTAFHWLHLDFFFPFFSVCNTLSLLFFILSHGIEYHGRTGRGKENGSVNSLSPTPTYHKHPSQKSLVTQWSILRSSQYSFKIMLQFCILSVDFLMKFEERNTSLLSLTSLLLTLVLIRFTIL